MEQPPKRSLSRSSIEYRFAQLHLDARRDALGRLPDAVSGSFELRPINAWAIRAWERSWVPHQPGPHSVGNWAWPNLVERFRRKADAFHLAVWASGDLCALAIGRTNRRTQATEVHYVEASPVPGRPRGVLVPVLEFADSWTRAMGLRQVRLVDPVPGVRRLYVETFGFVLVTPPRGTPYCWRDV
jgi:hypothetical protein